MNWLKGSINRVFGFTLIVFIATLFLVHYLFFNFSLKSSLEQQRKEQLLNETKHISTQIEMFLNKYTVIVEQAGSNPDFISIADNIKNRYKKRENPLYLKVTNQLIDIQKLDKNISLSYIALSHSNDLITNIYEYDATSDYDLQKREWYVTTINSNKTTITKPYLDLVTNKMIITIATPIMSNEELVGAFALDILIEDINNILNTYQVGNSGYPVLAYESGELLFHPDFDTTDTQNKTYIQDIFGDLTAKLLSGSGVIDYSYLEDEKFIAHMPIKDTGLIVFTIVPKAEVFYQLTKLVNINFILTIVFLALTAIILYLLNQYVTIPVIKISQEVKNYSSNSTMTISPKYLNRKDEIGILSNGILEMSNENLNYVLQIKEQNQELSKAKEEISLERSLLKTTLHSLGDGVISTDKQGNVDLINTVAEKLTGWKKDEAKGLPFEKVFHITNEYTGKKCPSPVELVFETGLIIELANHTMLIKKNGDKIPIEDSAAPIKDDEGNINGVVLVFRDFTDKKEKLEKINYLSNHDQLTTLYNRHYFEEQLRLLDNGKNLPFTVVMADVNGLKLTNDAFGHKAGDALLIRVANILKKECRSSDIVARVGGDEFVLLLPKTTNYETEKIIKRIHAAIQTVKQDNVILSVSFGWETKENHDQTISEVLSKAEEHMYRKKLVESQSMRNQTVKVIIQTLHETNIREKIHSEKVSQISRSIGEAMQLDSDTLKELEIAALMHDIGKIAINDRILNKARTLTDAEYEEIKRHPEIGYHILKSVDAYTNLADYVLSHHERWDGSGYPRGLSGDKIPLISRIIAVADSYEAMVGDRLYRKSMTPSEAIEELKRCSNIKFDPFIVEKFASQQHIQTALNFT